MRPGVLEREREREDETPVVSRAVPQVGTVFGRLEALEGLVGHPPTDNNPATGLYKYMLEQAIASDAIYAVTIASAKLSSNTAYLAYTPFVANIQRALYTALCRTLRTIHDRWTTILPYAGDNAYVEQGLARSVARGLAANNPIAITRRTVIHVSNGGQTPNWCYLEEDPQGGTTYKFVCGAQGHIAGQKAVRKYTKAVNALWNSSDIGPSGVLLMGYMYTWPDVAPDRVDVKEAPDIVERHEPMNIPEPTPVELYLNSLRTVPTNKEFVDAVKNILTTPEDGGMDEVVQDEEDVEDEEHRAYIEWQWPYGSSSSHGNGF
ncbi:MAG: hypothetical protein LBJ69_04225 [Holosporales bacterium]|nr:hypothetical protein [Holosporales bacterium]